MNGPPVSKLKRIMRILGINLGLLCLLLLLAEGLASYFLLGSDILSTRSIAERAHTRYDPELGWVNVPGLDLPDLYGEGIHFRTNRQGFRANRDIAPEVPPGKVRIICSGDSFTLGYGVSNNQTWCRQLTEIDPAIETVNMGQGGYGIDQAFLWYRRDGARLEHQVQILAFITGDFLRMRSDSFLGFGKPLVTTDGDGLVVDNVPVPRPNHLYYWWLKNMENIKRLGMVRLLAGDPGQGRGGGEDPGDQVGHEKIRKVLSLIFAELKRLNREKSSRLVLVYLPSLEELQGDAPDEWISFLEREAASQGLAFIDLVTEFRSRPYPRMAGLYISEGELDYPGAAGHFSKEGNRFVAELIYDRLTKDPATAMVISGEPSDG